MNIPFSDKELVNVGYDLIKPVSSFSELLSAANGTKEYISSGSWLNQSVLTNTELNELSRVSFLQTTDKFVRFFVATLRIAGGSVRGIVANKLGFKYGIYESEVSATIGMLRF